MIKDSDLRFGNLLEYGDGFISVDINVLRDLKVYLQNGLKPILITEEWLLKAGFEKDDSGVDMFDQDYCEWYQKEFPIIGLICQSSDKSYIFDENTDTLRLKYVHELQNLYFALTGSELVFSTEP